MTEAAQATLVDSDVLLDVIDEDPEWEPWSAAALADAADRGPLVINPVIYAEVSISFATTEELDAVLADGRFERAQIPWSAAFLAGRAFLAYRRRGGTRRSPLPDFFIGAHAAVLGQRLLTRDASRYRGYFPTVEVLAPGH